MSGEKLDVNVLGVKIGEARSYSSESPSIISWTEFESAIDVIEFAGDITIDYEGGTITDGNNTVVLLPILKSL